MTKKCTTIMTVLTAVLFCIGTQRQSTAQVSTAQTEARRVHQSMSNLLAQTKEQMLAQNTELSRLESKRRSEREQRTLLHLLETRRDLVFHYYETKIKALRDLKRRQPSLSNALDELISKTDRNWARDAKSLNERQARINQGYVRQPKPSAKKPAPRTTSPAKTKPSVNPNAEFARHMQLKDLKEKIAGLERQIAGWRNEVKASSAEYKRLTPAVNAAKTRRERDKAIAARNAAANKGHKANAKIGNTSREVTKLKRTLAKLEGKSAGQPQGKVYRDKNGNRIIFD